MKKFFLLLFVYLPLILIFCPGTKAQKVDSMMNVYAEQFPQQKVYVQFDKGLYLPGETIYFKAYLFESFQPATTSKNFFAELVDADGNIIQRKVYPIVEASAAGSFDIPDKTIASQYVFRGYTTWMLNFDSAFIFQKKIGIAGKSTSAKATPAQPLSANNLHFFPEGGDLVNTLQSVVAFKANDSEGLPVFVKGNILNNKGNVVTSFTAAHDGMGKFSLTPQPGENYTAQWEDKNGNKYTTALPVAKESGYSLEVSAVGKKRVFTLRHTENLPDNMKTVIVLAHLGQQMVYRARVPMQNTLVQSGTLPVDKLPSGVLQVTLFSEDWQPIAERVLLVNNDNYTFNAKINTLKADLNVRAKNEFEVEVADTVLSNLSLSVTDAAIIGKSDENNIISGMLLTGDIKGYVHNPAYYFSNNSDSVRSHLDLVMLTHGWRRFNWQNVVQYQVPKLKFPNDPYPSLQAKVYGINPASPMRSDELLTVIMVGKDSSKQIVMMPKTGKDVFSVENAIFYDTLQLFYQFQRDKRLNSNATVQFDNGLYKGAKKIVFNEDTRPPLFLPDTAALVKLQNLNDRYGNAWRLGNVLQPVIVKTRVRSKAAELDEKYTSGLFRGQDAISFDFTDDPAAASMDIFTYLQGRVPGLQINRTGGDVSLTWRNSATSLFLDEMPVEASTLSGMTSADIAYVKVFRPPFFGAFGGGAGGAVAVYTRKGGDVKPVPGVGLSRGRVVGYSYSKEFYSPDYSTRENSQEVVSDYRSTLYWKPMIFTDATRKKVKIEFYNNDITKSFRIIMEGVNELGKLVRVEKIVQ